MSLIEPDREALTDTATPTETEFDPRPYIDGVAGFLGGTANVIMQLSWPEVGYGVIESTVESGQVMRHPLKRLRTTLTYLAVAVLGTDEDRRLYRQAVNTSHRTVRSTEASPVEYNAFDPQLQLWVAACLYRGFEDSYQLMHGPLPEQVRDAFYRGGARLGTALQMQPDMWPADRAAFERYWEQSLRERVHIDDTVRSYLQGLVDYKMLPRLLRRLAAWQTRLYIVGYLPQRFREEMRMTWTARDQRRFERRMRIIGAVSRRLPQVLRLFPFNAYLWDMRRRVRTGRPLV
jgi:uncharacterized protein (DUF2236 family)